MVAHSLVEATVEKHFGHHRHSQASFSVFVFMLADCCLSVLVGSEKQKFKRPLGISSSVLLYFIFFYLISENVAH